MTVVLVVTRDKQQVTKAVVEKAEFLIGRSQRCDLRLEDSERRISREHATLRRVHDGFEIEDHASRNGVRVNNEPIHAPTLLAEGDVIGIGPYDIRFQTSEAGAARDDGDETSFVDAAGHVAKAGEATAAAKVKPAASRTGLRVTLRALDGPLAGTVFRDWGESLLIGRAESCDVVLPDEAVSKEHARIVVEAGQFVLVNLSQSNGTFVKGRRVERHVLASGDKVRIGTTNLRFNQTDPARTKRLLVRGVGALVVLLALGLLLKALKPPDPAAALVKEGTAMFKQGHYREAATLFEKAVSVSPRNETAKKGLAAAKKRAELAALIKQADAAVRSQDFDGAAKVLDAVFRIDPKHATAREMERVLKAVGEAKLALTSRNWVDAVQLLERARRSFTNSAVVASLLATAQQEADAAGKLKRAQEALARGDVAESRALLDGIAEGSVYRQEAVALLGRVATTDEAGSRSAAAREAYMAGRLDEAAKLCAEGLKLDPDFRPLQELKARVQAVQPSVALLQRKQATLEAEPPDSLRALRDACTTIASAEPEARAAVRVKAGEVADALSALSRRWQDEAQALTQPDQRKQALVLYTRASAADASNQAAVTQARALSEALTAESRKQFLQGRMHEELNQRDLAIAAYRRAAALAPDGSDYAEKSAERLRALQ